MSLLIPESGLLFWMLLSFGAVFFVLAKYGFPVIIKMISERKEFIENSLESAREANRQLSQIKTESDEILAKARQERTVLLNEALETQKQIINEAKQAAVNETRLQMQKASAEIEAAKERAIREIRSEIADISLRMTEKVVRKELDNTQEQTNMINRMLEDMYKSN